jgi:hypothetical protein
LVKAGGLIHLEAHVLLEMRVVLFFFGPAGVAAVFLAPEDGGEDCLRRFFDELLVFLAPLFGFIGGGLPFLGSLFA